MPTHLTRVMLMASDLFYLPPGFDGPVRLFPLSDLVMFPNNLLPLHIFESRYREMLEDAIQTDQLIAMSTLLPGFEHDYYSRPPVASTICIGRVTTCEKTAQGKYNLLLLGIGRAKIECEIEPVRSFRRARIKRLDEVALPGGDTAHQLGLQLTEQLRDVLPKREELVEKMLEGELSLGSLTDVLAFHLPLSSDVKLELLAEANSVVRAEKLRGILQTLQRNRPPKHRFPPDFSNN